jgi:hypothetical protein
VTDKWTVMLVPFSIVDGRDEIHWQRAVAMSKDVTAAERRKFYRSLLEISGLPPALYRVVMAELGYSPRKVKREFEEGWTSFMYAMIEEHKKRLRAQKARPRGGIHDLAIAEMARESGTTVTALKKRLQRYKRRRRI